MINHKNSPVLGNNVLCLGFIDPLQNHCLLFQSPAKIVHIIEITCKEIMFIECQSWGGGDKNIFYQLGVKFGKNALLKLLLKNQCDS